MQCPQQPSNLANGDGNLGHVLLRQHPLAQLPAVEARQEEPMTLCIAELQLTLSCMWRRLDNVFNCIHCDTLRRLLAVVQLACEQK